MNHDAPRLVDDLAELLRFTVRQGIRTKGRIAELEQERDELRDELRQWCDGCRGLTAALGTTVYQNTPHEYVVREMERRFPWLAARDPEGRG